MHALVSSTHCRALCMCVSVCLSLFRVLSHAICYGSDKLFYFLIFVCFSPTEEICQFHLGSEVMRFGALNAVQMSSCIGSRAAAETFTMKD